MMFFKTILVSALAAVAIADEQSSLDAMLASASSLMAIMSDIPTLPASVQSVLLTAVPTTISATAVGCEIATATPAWYKSLPADVKSALTSYESAASSWYSKHSTDLAGVTSGVPAVVGCSGVTGTKGNAASATGTASGAAASNTSKGAAAAPTGAVVASLAGVLGVFGVMVAL
ncbi:hypothetical protein BGZ60DRAFT_400359 [Tricladium varicosporioides]|nr:hypothetical protein BGZ60DRAFT_400359 [Hymenoscyphus varicosporioides]